MHQKYCYVLKKVLYSVVGCKKEKNPIKKIGYKILNCIPKRIVFERFEKMAQKYSDRNKYKFVADYSFSTTSLNDVIPRKWLLKLVEVHFKNKNFFAPYCVHKWLTRTYGNYMELPPVEQRTGSCDITIFEISDTKIQNN